MQSSIHLILSVLFSGLLLVTCSGGAQSHAAEALTPSSTSFTVNPGEPSQEDGLSNPTVANPPTWFPLTLPWDDASHTAMDASDLLLDRPGGDPATVIDARGFVTTDADGHFVFSNTGKRARFWGTNLAFSANFPPAPDYPPSEGEFGDVHAAEKLAARLAKLGFNAVRIHHIDNAWGGRPHSIFLDSDQNTQVFDPVQLGRLDYLIYQFKRHGIYVDLNMHVSREFVRGDGVIDAAAFAASEISYNKGATLFDPVMIGLQKDYAAKLLSHVNPYTGLSYANDPVIFTTETTNEDSIFRSFADQSLHDDRLPAFYSQELDGWSQKAGGSDLNRLRNPGFESGFDDWYSYIDSAAQATFETAPDAQEGSQSLKVTVSQAGGQEWHVQFGQNDLAFQAGQRYRIRFTARASQPATIYVAAGRDREPWDDFGLYQAVDISTAWQTYSVEFTPTKTVFGDGRVYFNVGDSAGELWFDAIRFQEVEPIPGWRGWLTAKYGDTASLRNAWATDSPVPDVELLSNGGFESGMDPWRGEVNGAAAATFTVDDAQASQGARSLRVDVTQVGEDWHVQLIQGLAVTEGETYRISFDAKASAPGDLGFGVMQDHDPWSGLGSWGVANLGQEWKHFEYTFTATAGDADARLNVAMGDAQRTLWFDNFSLKPHAPDGLLPGESLENDNIVRLRPNQLSGYTPQRGQDMIQFYDDLQSAYFADMRSYFQDTLDAHSLNTGTTGYGSLADIHAMASLDYIDNHFYWDHPGWPNVAPWSPTGWVIQNQAWVNAPFDGLFEMAVTAVQGKPLAVTEWDQPFPNRYAVEAPLLLATFANLQDWDALFQFEYVGDQNFYDADKVEGFFDLSGNPVAAGLMPVAARLFLAQQTDPAPTVSALSFTSQERYESFLDIWDGNLGTYLQENGVDRAAAFGGRLRISDLDAPTPVSPDPPAPAGPVYGSDGGQLTWDISDPARGLYTFDAPRAQGVVGFMAGRTVTLGNLDLTIPAGTADFAAITLQSWDGQSIANSNEMILGVFTRVENSDMVWNDEHTSIDDRWGTAPALVESMAFSATLALPNADDVEVWALDETGAPDHQVPVRVVAADRVQVSIDTAVDATLWYAIRRSVKQSHRLNLPLIRSARP